MNTTLGRLGGACCALLAATAMLGSDEARAGDKGPPHLQPYFGVYGGINAVVGDWDLSFFPDEGVSPATGPMFGLRAGLQVTHWFGFEGGVDFIPFMLEGDGGGLAMDWEFNTLWSPFDFKISPFGLIGIGMYHSAYGDLGDDADWEFHYGFGLRAMLTDWFAFRFEAKHNITDSYSNGSASVVEWTLGVDVFPWAYKDEVVEKDTDGDGVLDKDDKCPMVYGLRALQGCPDTDGDGIRDSDDRCPTLPGPVANQGCPDTDGDGIFDDVDECKTVPGVPEFKGCPAPISDSDGDGIADADDKCPTVKGLKELQGCLPTEQFANLKVEDILFVSGSAKLSKRSYDVLDEAVKLLNQYPTVLLDIHGHTDNQGPDDYNQKLSEDRAAAVVDYLISKGIARDRLSSKGFGESEPIAPNNTAAGRQKNRRTEFHIRTL